MRADTIQGRHYYFHARGDTGAGAKWSTKCMWTPVVDERLTCITFPNTCRSFLLASSILTSFSLGTSPTTWLQCGYLSGWVQILIEGGYYSIKHRQSCGYYLRKYSVINEIQCISHQKIQFSFLSASVF